MKLASSYDRDVSELTVYIEGKEYIYTHISPFHNSEFVKKAKRNRGRALAYVRTFPRKDED